MSKLWNDIVSILKAPFVGQLDLSSLFWLVGVVLVFVFLWVLILHTIRVTASEVI